MGNGQLRHCPGSGAEGRHQCGCPGLRRAPHSRRPPGPDRPRSRRAAAGTRRPGLAAVGLVGRDRAAPQTPYRGGRRGPAAYRPRRGDGASRPGRRRPHPASSPPGTTGPGAPPPAHRAVARRGPGGAARRRRRHLRTADAAGRGQLSLQDDDAERFAALTERAAERTSPMNQLAIVLGDRLISAPAVAGPITGGEVQIAGAFTEESAKSLARELGAR
ncbi:SecDF P1 head subdomain-containing protein [Streptomyces sp. NPDC018693]|uniref:SecDF P1 head subdomain-containing protein n=1 Tax=unclassified Streptomyces TaxID=2593676 RepID=UPI0037A66229